MKIAVCDDERKWIFEIEKYLEKLRLEYAEIQWDDGSVTTEIISVFEEVEAE